MSAEQADQLQTVEVDSRDEARYIFERLVEAYDLFVYGGSAYPNWTSQEVALGKRKNGPVYEVGWFPEVVEESAEDIKNLLQQDRGKEQQAEAEKIC